MLLVSGAFAQGERPLALRNVGIDQRLDQQVPLDLPFRDETGKIVRLGDYFGDRPVILSLVYYECPMLCTLVLNGLVRVMGGISFNAGDQFNVVTVSFDARETPALAAAKKKTYLERYHRPGAEKGWRFLTGDESSIESLTRAAGFRYAFDRATGQWAHATAIMVLTPEGKLARYFYGVEYSARDLRLALVEASRNRIGTPTDQVLLFCFHYDPASGKYGLAILNIIRAIGVTTALALGVFMFVMFRRERGGSG
ncbi:MAG: SCO family protein [Acidobacteriota bacterium]